MNTMTNANTILAPRRGSVLIFALAILAVLALLGATYVTRAKLDRVSAEASVRRSTLKGQSEIVIEHAGALLAADLFGNKIVRDTTPRTIDPQDVESIGSGANFADIDIWPAMFEDGEHWDYPSVDEVEYERANAGVDKYTFLRPDATDNEREAVRLKYDASIGRFETARPDDAWLSATEPVDHTGIEPLGSYAGAWDTWPQITNLRSAYSWVDDADGDERGAWVRDDGRYADLALFFNTTNARNRMRGDPAADLLDRENNQDPFYAPDDASSVLNLDPEFNSALLGVEQRRIFGLQMNQLSEWYESGASFNPDTNEAPFEPVDERFWADTDGDGRPDARWTVLDELDGQGGMRWVVAMRIADSSAAVNVNTAIEGLSPLNTHLAFGDGATPMDADLSKLFMETAALSLNATSARANASLSLRHPDIINQTPQNVRTGLRRHLLRGLGFDEDLVEGDQTGDSTMESYFGDSDNAAVRDFIGWQNSDDNFNVPGGADAYIPTTRAQREAYWRLFASRPDSPLIRGAQRYDLKEEVELRAAFAANFPGVKTLESNFDGAADTAFSRLPGDLGAPYPDRESLGPMRSAEWGNAVARDDLTNVDLPEFTGGNYSQQQRIERIQKDVRRSLTVASGASARSVVPAIGEREVNPGRLKPQVNPTLDLMGSTFTSPLDVMDAFEAFTWALAPLATNKPLMGALTAGGNWVSDYETDFSASDDFHYGGGANGPAVAWASDVAIAGDPGPTYALFRAASMAVNLKDAVDNEGDNPAPTIARLFTAPEPTPLPTDQQLLGSEILTTRFAHGDIDDADNPTGAGAANGASIIPTSLTQPQNGVTFVGLDRQPFITKAYVTTLYDYVDPTIQMNGVATPLTINDDTNLIGRSIVAIELVNPWDTPIDLAPYTLMLTDGTEANKIEIQFIDLAASAPVLEGGERHVVLWADFDPNTNMIFSASWDDVLSSIPGSGNANFVSKFGAVVDTNFASPFTTADRPFDGWDEMKTGVLLYREGPAASSQLLVDRITRDPTAATRFPISYNGAPTQADPEDPTEAATASSYGVMFAFASAIERPADDNAEGGFTPEVIENPRLNGVVEAIATQITGSYGWFDFRPASQTHVALTEEVASSDLPTFGARSDYTGLALTYPYSLFVPDGPLIATSELGQICTFAHTYIHNSATPPTVTAADVLVDPAGASRSNWTTVSEQLGKDYHLAYDATTSDPVAIDNPYLGVLDPTRYILGSSGDLGVMIPDLPDTMAVPLALRVYDAFEVLGDQATRNSALVEGRININTAPKRVLATLPLVLPVDYTTGAIPSRLNELNSSNAYARLNGMMQYRERLGALWSSIDDEIDWADWHNIATPSQAQALTQLPGIRTRYDDSGSPPSAAIGRDDHRKGRGFSSLGELSVLSRWTFPSGLPTPSMNIESGFLELADDGENNNVENSSNQRNALDVRPAENLVVSTEATDDVEERLALFRAVSNIATTRSDVYHAWYIARAYAPAAIEGVEVDPMLSTIDERAELLNDLPVAFEERGFLVLDRSNVRLPTDRPRILLRVVLDSTTAAN